MNILPKWLVKPFEYTALNHLNISADVDKNTNVGRLATGLEVRGLIPTIIIDHASNTILYGNEYAKACKEINKTYIPIIPINPKSVPDNIRQKDLFYIKASHEDKLGNTKIIGRAMDLLALKMSVQFGDLTRLLEYAKISQSEFDRYIKIAKVQQTEKLPDTNISLNKLYEIALIPEKHRFTSHTVNGKTKLPHEMTVRELRELKKQIKQEQEEKSQLESQLSQAQRSESIARKHLEDAEDKEPVVEKQETKQDKSIDAREQINRDSRAVEPEVRRMMQYETSANALVNALEEIVDIHDKEIDDYEVFDKVLSTLNYKALKQAQEKINHFIQVGGY